MDNDSAGKESITTEGKRKLPGMISIFLIGCAVGVAIGGYGGFRFGMGFILNTSLAKDAREVESRISILRHLRTGEQDVAVNQLENGLNDMLILFDPHTPYPDLKQQTVVALREAIDKAKEYRSAYPRPADQKDARDSMVQDLFSREVY